MEGEVYKFLKAWIIVFISLSYCYAIGKSISKGSKRLFFFLPIICLFLLLPLNLHSFHFCGFTAFFISWLANFKLLLYAFDNGPLSSSSISFTHFILLACFPIKIKQNLHRKGHYKQNQVLDNGKKYLLNYTLKITLAAIFVHVHDYREFIHPKIILLVYCFHIYIAMELVFAIFATLARAMSGFELEPQFNEPYLSSSLQDFWGRRWNLMATNILRPTVYEPVLNTFTPTIGREWSPLPAIMGVFIVSGIMHEIVFYYLDLQRLKPKWAMSQFFLLHGFSLAIEIGLKKLVNRRWQLPRLISVPLTIAYMMCSGIWLVMPVFYYVEADTRAFQEYKAVINFFRNAMGVK